MVMIFKGSDGDDHRIFQFADNAEKKKTYFKQSTKDGKFKIALSQNCFLRLLKETFIIVTSPSGRVEATAIEPIEKKKNKIKDPVFVMDQVQENYDPDVWVHHTGGKSIMSLTKSKVDDFLCANCMDCTKWEDGDLKTQEEVNKAAKQNSAKIRSQEIQIIYPVIASNCGSNRVNIQSIMRPNEHYTFSLPNEEEFLCFTIYDDPTKIGLRDTRKKEQ